MKFVPKPPQIPIIEHALSINKGAVHASMGVGKTSATLYCLNFMNTVQERRTLVVAPKYVAQYTWPDEVEKWGFSELGVSVVCGTPGQRIAALNRKDANLFCINYENVVWLEETLKVHKNWQSHFDRCVIDEATKVKSYRRNHGSSRARALFHLVAQSKYLIELTGTPAGNGWLDLWGQMFFIDRGERLGKTFEGFKQRWFTPVQCGEYFTKWVPNKVVGIEIPATIADVCRSIDAKDYVAYDNPIITKIPVTLPPKARKIYDEVEETYYADLEKGAYVDAKTAADKSLKCLQIASGAVYTDETQSEWQIIHDGKLDALEVILGECNGSPLLVVYHFRHDIARISKRFKQCKVFSGDLLSPWNKGDIPMMLAHPASVGHGLNLQDGGQHICFFSHWWSLEEKQQIIERIGPLRQLQSGHPRPVYQYEIYAKDTMDERVLLAHEAKQAIGDCLKQGTRGK